MSSLAGRCVNSIQRPGSALVYCTREYEGTLCGVSLAIAVRRKEYVRYVQNQHARGRDGVKQSVTRPRRRKRRPVEMPQSLGNSSSAGWWSIPKKGLAGGGKAGSPKVHACTGLYGLYCSVDTVFDARARVSESRPLRLRPEPDQGTMQHAQMPLRRSQRLGQCDMTRFDRLGYWLRLGSVCGVPSTQPMISSHLCAWPLPVTVWPLLFISFPPRLLFLFCPFFFYPFRLFGRVVVLMLVVVMIIIWSLAGPR